VSVVGTRHCTAYGRDATQRIVGRLRELCPDALVVSGLAYGIDICAHRAALDGGLTTAAVLAHGLDTIYPPSHRSDAARMVREGGSLISEYCTQTTPNKVNFLRRNRIVAGMSDVTVVVESATRGGALVTARLAAGYGRRVMAVPGSIGAECSAGCNLLIRDGKATLLSSAAELVGDMGWQADGALDKARARGIERTFFPNLTTDQQALVTLLEQGGDLQLDALVSRSGRGIGDVTTCLLTLELQGIVRRTAGNSYHLIR